MKEIILVGAGNMGGALLRGWSAAWNARARFTVVDPVNAASALSPAQELTGVRYYAEIADLPSDLTPDLVVIAVKPDKILPLVHALAHRLTPETILVSVAAGVTIDSIRGAASGANPVVRVMPNIGANVGYSVSAGFADADLSPVAQQFVDDLFSSIGQMSWLEKEEDLHLVTAVSGSGPAYYFAFCEAFAAAAEAMGLKSETAQALAIGTAVSAGRLLSNRADPRRLLEQVTSPNGTTAAGLEALQSGGTSLTQLVADTIGAAKQRSLELSQTGPQRQVVDQPAGSNASKTA